MNSNWSKKIVAMLALLAVAGAASAQYVWLDDKGNKQFSDMPPPASVPNSRILKAPAKSSNSAPESTSASASASASASQAAAAKAPMTIAEKNADFKKRRVEQAEKDKKAEEKAQQDAAKAKNCEQARSYNRALTGGQRMAKTDKNGERVFLSDAERAQEAKEVQRVIDRCK